MATKMATEAAIVNAMVGKGFYPMGSYDATGKKLCSAATAESLGYRVINSKSGTRRLVALSEVSGKYTITIKWNISNYNSLLVGLFTSAPSLMASQYTTMFAITNSEYEYTFDEINGGDLVSLGGNSTMGAYPAFGATIYVYYTQNNGSSYTNAGSFQINQNRTIGMTLS